MGPAAYFAPTLAGKRCISEVAPIDLCFRIKHYKGCVTMPQCRIWGRGTGNAGKWEALTRETQGKKTKKSCSIPATSFSLVLLSDLRG